MNNILLAIDPEKLDPKHIHFGCYLAKLTQSKLTGVFLENMQLDEAPTIKFAYGAPYVETIDTRNLPENQFKLKLCEKNIRIFKKACENQGIAYAIHRDQSTPVKEMLSESRFADLIIIDPSSFSSSPLEIPTGFVKDVLAKTECPVIISPYLFEHLDEILFAYDGNASSAFAIKQFTYLFPELKNAKITVLQADETGVFKKEDKEKIYEYLKLHYANIAFHDLSGKPSDELFDYLIRQSNACVVMGAFGRSRLSNMLRHSTAELLIKINNLPIFIAHH